MKSAASLSLAAALAVTASCGGTPAGARAKQVIVLGVDGMDPVFVERNWSALPNLAKLRQQGKFQRLKTTTPPQSPVAWSTFITGMDPDAHGIFDFVHRDPATLAPFSSMSRTDPPRFELPLGPYLLPLSSPRFVSLRAGRPFWRLLSDGDVPVTVIRMPTNYPPEPAGQALSGMGVPDLRGGFGTFTFYSDDPQERSRSVAGGEIVRVDVTDGRTVLNLEGPPNPLRRDHRMASVNLTVNIDRERPLARIDVGGEQLIVRQGEWSDWVRVKFPLFGALASATGMVRLYAKQLQPGFEMYITPVNVDPGAPALPVSNPSDYSRAIAKQIGPWYTQGIAEDTAALRQGVFKLDEYLAQSGLVLADEMKLLRLSLEQFRTGFLFFYFSAIDQNSHMLWGTHDQQLLDTYRAIDAAIGHVRAAAPRADLIVMSDHGFTSFSRSFNLNAWLSANGYLRLHGGLAKAEEPFADVDWSATQAYGIGLNALYLNLSGREKHGVVGAGRHADDILARIRDGLLAFRDPDNGRQVVQSVYAPRSRNGSHPDLVIGYGSGYRASWQSALGSVSGSVSIVNAPGGSMTTVVLVVASTFNEALKRGDVPPGLRAPKAGVPSVSGAFTIADVPDGNYVVLAAFENDALVRDPDTEIGGTQIQRVTLGDGGRQATLPMSFKITEALTIMSPGAGDAIDTVSGTPTFVW
jgi:predicted AlkP superfamily phosphohydrolase/phosphomutase